VCLLVVYTFYIKMDLQEAEWGGMDWIGLAQDRDRWRAFVKTVMICIKVFHSGHSSVNLNLVVVLNKCTISSFLETMVKFLLHVSIAMYHLQGKNMGVS